MGNPWTYAEAISYPNAANWDTACKEEIKTFQQMGVYKIVPQPKGRKVIGSKWVFHIKHGPDGNVQKYKYAWLHKVSLRSKA